MDDTGESTETSTPTPSSEPDLQSSVQDGQESIPSSGPVDANGQPVGNPALEARPWPFFLLNLLSRIAAFSIAAALLPVSLGVLWFKNMPAWEVIAMGGTSGLSIVLISIFLQYVRKGKITKRDLDVTVALSADALVNNYTLNNQYTYLQIGQQQ